MRRMDSPFRPSNDRPDGGVVAKRRDAMSRGQWVAAEGLPSWKSWKRPDGGVGVEVIRFIG